MKVVQCDNSGIVVVVNTASLGQSILDCGYHFKGSYMIRASKCEQKSEDDVTTGLILLIKHGLS